MPLAKNTIKAGRRGVSLQTLLPCGPVVWEIWFSGCDYPALSYEIDNYESIVFKGILTGALQ